MTISKSQSLTSVSIKTAPWELQTKLLHYFFTSNNKSNLHFTANETRAGAGHSDDACSRLHAPAHAVAPERAFPAPRPSFPAPQHTQLENTNTPNNEDKARTQCSVCWFFFIKPILDNCYGPGVIPLIRGPGVAGSSPFTLTISLLHRSAPLPLRTGPATNAIDNQGQTLAVPCLGRSKVRSPSSVKCVPGSNRQASGKPRPLTSWTSNDRHT